MAETIQKRDLKKRRHVVVGCVYLGLTLLMIGAICNLAVAIRCWVISIRLDRSEPGTFTDLSNEESRELAKDFWDDFDEESELHGSREDSFGATTFVLSDYTPQGDRTGVRFQIGAPFRCLEGRRQLVFRGMDDYTEGWSDVATVPGIRLPVPRRILWVGFLANMAFYSALILVVIVAATRIQRRARIDRLHCPNCRKPIALPSIEEMISCAHCAESTRGELFKRPKQILRWWFIPVLLPALYLFVFWFVGEFSITRRHLRYDIRLFSFQAAISLVTGYLWVFVIAIRAYSDRSRPMAYLLSGLVSVILTTSCYLSLRLLVWHYW